MRFFSRQKSSFRTRLLGLCGGLLLLAPQLGWAVGTTAGTTISNVATVNYVIGIAPPSTATSNTVSFLVDRKVNMLVAEVNGSATSVNSGQTGMATAFSVTNLGNDAQGFNLTAALATGNPATGGIAPFTTNDFSATGLVAYVDAVGTPGNTVGVYDPLIDTATTIPTLAAGASQTVFIVGNIPATALNGQQSVVSLTATAVVPATMAALVATAGADTAGVDVVFADSTGVAAGDIARDAKHSAYDAYLSGGPLVSVVLTKTVLSVVDPNGRVVLAPASGDPALIPKSTLTYQIVATLSDTGTATNLVITDPLPAATAYVPGSIMVTCGTGTYTAGACGTGTITTPQPAAAKTDTNTDTDFADFTTNTVSVSLGNVASPANVVITFRATIN